MKSSFSPAWWLRGAHGQTMWGKFFRRAEVHDTRIERLETPDGDFIDLHHVDAPADAPILLVLHGLEGSVRSHYAQGLLAEARKRQWHGVVLTFRSCGSEMNRTRRSYHSGETTDAHFVIQHLESSFPEAPLILAGVSLGGNVLLKYLGEQGTRISPRVKGAAAVSVPYDLAQSSRYINEGFARVYQWNFLRSLVRKAQSKLEQFPDLISRDALGEVRTMWAFDDWFTAPVHGFRDATDYYSRSSSINWLQTISVNTLLLSAVDDPFLPSDVLARVQDIARRNSHLEVEFPPHGGHVGFIGGGNPLSPVYYLEQRVSEFLAHELETS